MTKLSLFTIGGIIGGISFALAWHWFGWHLSLIIFLALLGNNLSMLTGNITEKKDQLTSLSKFDEKEFSEAIKSYFYSKEKMPVAKKYTE